MKKTVFIFSLVFVLVSLAGCSNKNDPDSSSVKRTYRQASSMPMVVLIKDGKVVKTSIGYTPKDQIEAMRK